MALSLKKLGNSIYDLVENSNKSFMGGLGRGIVRGAEWLLPGDQKAGAEKINRTLFPEARPGSLGQKVGSAQKGIVDVASMIIPSTATTRVISAAPQVSRLAQAGRAGSFAAKAIPEVIGGIPGSGIYSLQQRGQGKDPNLGRELATGAAIDLAVPPLLRGASRGIRSLVRGGSDIPVNRLTSYEGAPDRARVDFYKGEIQNGRPVAPLKVKPDSLNNLGVEDGKHRLQAYKELGYENVPVEGKPKVKPTLRFKEKVSPDRIIRENITQPIERKINKGIYEASVSKNPIVRGTARLAQGFNREIGTPEELLAAKRKFYGGQSMGKILGADTTKLGGELDGAARTRVWATLDPEQAAKKGIKPGTLTPEEQAFRQQLIDVVEPTTQGNLQRGLIDENQAANPNYLKRGYEVFEEVQDPGVYQKVRQNLLGQYKGRKDVSERLIDQAITDPAYLAGKKLAQSHQAWAHVDYANFLVDNGYTFSKGRNGLVQLPESKLYGKASGQWVAPNIAEDFRGFQYQNAALNAFNDLITAYDGLGIRQAKKQLLTIFNPGVRVGNQASNRVVFSTLNGLNPIEFNRVMQSTKNMISGRDPLYMEAVGQGLMGTDITQAEFVKRISQYADDPNILRKARDWVQSSYSEADDRARLAAYVMHRKQGYDPAKAAQLTQRGFQDYRSVGFFYDMAAKAPVIGNAFVRFAGDATRIMKNSLVDHPLRTLSLVAMYASFNDLMSKFSGETPEDRSTRENRFGAPKIPFTDVSLTTQTPWGEVNVARFMPFYQLNEVQGQISRFLPIQNNPLKPEGWNDPLLGQVGQVLADKDFRGKSIQDPNNTVYYGEGDSAVKKYPELPTEDKRNNVVRFLASQNLPLGREADAVISAAQGKPDVYGKERSVAQALGRAVGVKVEQFGPEQAQKSRDTNRYFEGNVERVKQFTKNNPDLAQDYYKFSNPTRDRKTGVKTGDLVTPERWKVVSADASGRLYNFLKQEALTSEKEDGRPVDPIFKLPTSEQAKQVLELRSRPTGDDIETEEILRATKPWYAKFEKAEGEYYDSSAKYWESKGLGSNTMNARVKAYRDVPYPEQSSLIKQYYQVKSANPDQGKEFYKANADRLSADFNKYRQLKLGYINAKRKIEGFPPISEDSFNNVTFGYEDDERKVYNQLKYGKGFGGFKPTDPTANKYRYAISLSAGGEAARPKVSVKDTGAPKRKKAKAKSAPKLALKKSQV